MNFTICNLHNSVFSKCEFFPVFLNALKHVLFRKKTFGKTRVSWQENFYKLVNFQNMKHFSLYLWALIPENKTQCETKLFIKQVTSRDQELPYHYTDLFVIARYFKIKIIIYENDFRYSLQVKISGTVNDFTSVQDTLKN